MVITRADWRMHGDLLQWLALEYPGLPPAQFEAGYRQLRDPDLSAEAEADILELLAGCVAARAARIAPVPHGGAPEGSGTSETADRPRERAREDDGKE